jgi:hypothetical protein
MGKLSALVVYCIGTVGSHTLKKHDVADTLFEILEGWGT